ncbi:hypothetical protein NQ317_014950 [Molorchus minor]|uniref:N-acetyltransferase domain-containing protein n=1 Tax=Molorchus minor TaxID=1323400 RepID=A0ABQ9JZP8_9CUCU|nr:hypothetical protein NQ317_014950 [Molorchus minor]
MYINRDTTITGKSVILVPYRKEHVLKYHEWMQSTELQLLTASEPLSLEEEYAMQKSWLMDENKCTFIILDRERYQTTGSEVEAMIGDTNLFFANADDRICAEAEIMIAENWARRRKCGWEAMLLMFVYSIEYLNVKQYIVKISYVNVASINMFKNMGFTELSRSDVFKEITFCKIVDNMWITWIKMQLGKYEVKVGSN